MKQTPTTKSLSDEEDLTQSWLIGPTVTDKVLFVLEFKRKERESVVYWYSIQYIGSQRRDYRERGEPRARAQHDILIRSLEKVAGEAEGENGGWKIKLIIFVWGKWISECTDLQRQS